MTKTITNNNILENFDCFEIIENIKEVEKLQKVHEASNYVKCRNSLFNRF